MLVAYQTPKTHEQTPFTSQAINFLGSERLAFFTIGRATRTKVNALFHTSHGFRRIFLPSSFERLPMLKLVIEKNRHAAAGRGRGGGRENRSRDRNNVTNSSNSNLIPPAGLQAAAHKYFPFFRYVFIAVGLRREMKAAEAQKLRSQLAQESPANFKR